MGKILNAEANSDEKFVMKKTINLATPLEHPINVKSLSDLLENRIYNQPQRKFFVLTSDDASFLPHGTSMFYPSSSNNMRSEKTPYSKKSLKKFHSSQSRNCFFSPINCMIQHDVKKIRKMMDLSS
uniref:Uncharacterized protein n=1 Tax=Rhabditophanes sp. KR3021 TaxID=114890 RepID=A0AC35U7V5_9BILA